MNAIERMLNFLASLFGGTAQSPATDLTGGTVPASSVDYGLAPTPGPLTGDAPVNFPASLTYWTWNLYGPDVSGTPAYPASVTGAATGGGWRQRVADFLASLGPSPTVPPIAQPNTPPSLPTAIAIAQAIAIKGNGGVVVDPIRPSQSFPVPADPAVDVPLPSDLWLGEDEILWNGEVRPNPLGVRRRSIVTAPAGSSNSQPAGIPLATVPTGGGTKTIYSGIK